ncbi:hypothetical protein M885DRAFT_544988 [Pelagophyceae sp. CCMP2097]|nr:hypothetical protein M885DRAFT_544988 [Pelagophyceae sp. CCMP2097]
MHPRRPPRCRTAAAAAARRRRGRAEVDARASCAALTHDALLEEAVALKMAALRATHEALESRGKASDAHQRQRIHSLEVLETWLSWRPNASTPKVAFLSGNAPTESAASRVKVAPLAPCSNCATKTPSMPEASCEMQVGRTITASRTQAMRCHELSRLRTISQRPAIFAALSGGGMPLACPFSAPSPTIAHHWT